jgi:WD40 repeat protein
MQLNLIAGRTFNDLSQYPIFPWVIKDYKSKTLDLKDENTFRDMKWPMGAQIEFQRQILKDKYEACESIKDEDFPPYHNGSHYSTSAVVIWYLIRLEPFTSYHVWLQEGRFDRADRLFFSIEGAYKSCTTNSMDVKELIPEFFFNAEFLENINDVYFGTTQNGKRISEVELPNWCRDSTDFVKKNREALESEYVSQNLHHWIDLIFGSKQRPPHLSNGSVETIKSCNVFVHLTYSDAVNLELLKANDKVLYEQTISQIECFGQTPEQLFEKPHPKRLSHGKVELIWPIASILNGVDTIQQPSQPLDKPTKILCYGEVKVSSHSILMISHVESIEKLVTVDSYRRIGFHNLFIKMPDIVPPFVIKLDKNAVKGATTVATTSNSITAASISSKSPIQNFLAYNSAVKEKIAGLQFASELQSQNQIGKTSNFDLEFDLQLIGSTKNKYSYKEQETLFMRNEKIKEKKSFFLINNNDSSSISNKIKYRTPSSSNTSNNNRKTLNINRNQNFSTDNLIENNVTSPYIAIAKEVFNSPNPSSSNNDLKNVNTSENEIDRSTSIDTRSKKASRTSSIGTSTGNKFVPPLNLNQQSQQNDVHLVTRKERADEHLSCNLFALLPNSRLLFSCGHWDNSFKITAADTGKLIQSVSFHKDLVTCLTVASDYDKHWLVTGSKDCVILIWKIASEREVLGDPVDKIPLHQLYGHDDSINCVAVNAELDLIASGSDDGTVMLHTLREGVYLRSLLVSTRTTNIRYLNKSMSNDDQQGSNNNSPSNNNTPIMTARVIENSDPRTPRFVNNVNDKKEVPYFKRKIHLIAIGCNGCIITFSNDGNLLSSHTMNGKMLNMINTRERLHVLCLSEDGSVVITGGERCLLVFRWTSSLYLANTGPRKDLDCVVDGSDENEIEPMSSPIRSLFLTNQEQLLIVGLESGHVRILAQVFFLKSIY